MRRTLPTRPLALLAFLLLPALAVAAVLVATDARTASGEGEARTFVIDKVHSALLFKVGHLGVSYTHGRFNDFNGTIVMDEANPANSKVEIDIHAESIDTNCPDRDKHLRNKDFFDVEKHPSLGFVSTSVTSAGENDLRVTGDFTLLGVTKEVTIRMKKIGEAKDPWGGYRVGYEGQVVIKRSDFGMSYGLNAGVGDEVFITLAVEAIQKKS